MADNLDDLDKEFSKKYSSEGTWDVAPKQADPKDFGELDTAFKKRLREPPRVYPQIERRPEAPLSDFEGQSLQIGPINTHIPLPASVTRGLAQLGSGFSDVGLGYRQMTGNATKQEAAEKAYTDDPLNRGISGTLNSSAGKIAPFIPVPSGWAPQAMKWAGPIFEGLAAGGAQGAFEPVKPGESRGANVAIGAGAGAIFPALVATAKGASTPDDATKALVASAEREGIPLSTTDVTRNKLIKAFRSFANDLPVTGSANEATREAQQAAFNKAVGARWGSQATKHTPDQRVIDKKQITDVMDQVWGNNNLPYDANLFGSLRQLEHDATLHPGPIQNAVMRHIDDLESKVQVLPNGDHIIPGDAAKQFQSDLYKKYGGKEDPEGYLMQKLRGTILDNFNSNVTGADAKALTQARSQYRAFKATEPALRKADAGVAQREIGDVRPVDLSSALVKNYPEPSRTPFKDLPQIGQRFMRDTSPQTGGSIRAMIQNTTLAGGALTGAGLLTNPLASLGIAGSFIGANKALNSPALRKMLQDPKQTRLLLDNPNTAEAAREVLQSMVRRAPATGALAATNALASSPSEQE